MASRTSGHICARVLNGFHIRCRYSGNDPSFAPKPGPSVYGTRLFLACLALDLDLIAGIVHEIEGHFNIQIQIDAEFVGIAQRESFTAHFVIHLSSTEC